MSMPGIRLTGLLLLITATMIGLASAATRTSHIKFKRPDSVAAREQATEASGEEQADRLQFISIPILYPLLGVGMLGMMLWFAPAGLDAARPRSKPRRRSRRKNSRSKSIFSLGSRRPRR